MPKGYELLAKERVEAKWPGYHQPEDFGYDFREWVSPYTKSAHARGGVAVVLQDWASADRLSRGVEPAIQKHGRDPGLLTNRRLDALLQRVFSLTIDRVYVTNAFPFVKPGGMSQPVPMSDLCKSVETFTKPELELVRPTMILALGKLPSMALIHSGLRVVALPHPAARIGSTEAHEVEWRSALKQAGQHGL
jgi:restriction system protein